MKESLSVRKVEQLIRTRVISGGKPKTGRSARRKDPLLISMEEEMQRRLGTAVRIARSGKKGKIEIEFYSNDDLERIIEVLRGNE